MSRHEKQQRRKHRKEKRSSRRGHGGTVGRWLSSGGLSAVRREVPEGPLSLLSYDITYEPLKERTPGTRSLEDVLSKSELQQLHDQVFNEPEVAIVNLERMVHDFPDVPILYNWLAAAHNQVGNDNRANEVVRLNYERFPGYLFARIGYAQLCLEANDIEGAERVMEGKWDLKALHPERGVFHLTEFVAMMGVAIPYALKTGNRRSALTMLEMLEKIAPESPITDQMRQRVNDTELFQLLKQASRRLFGKF